MRVSNGERHISANVIGQLLGHKFAISSGDRHESFRQPFVLSMRPRGDREEISRRSTIYALHT